MVQKNIFLTKMNDIERPIIGKNIFSTLTFFPQGLFKVIDVSFRTTIHFLLLYRVAYVQICKEDALLHEKKYSEKKKKKLT